MPASALQDTIFKNEELKDSRPLDSNSVEVQLPKNDLDSFNFGKNAPPAFDKLEGNKVPAPTSSNFFKNIISARDTARGGYRRLMNIGEICICSLSITFIFVILMAIPIAMIVVGTIHIKNCPIQKLIPIWLIILGSLTILKNISTLTQRIKVRKDERATSKLLTLFDSFLALVIIIWFICGNIWTYSNYAKYKKDSNSDDYCHPVVINFAFWLITAVYILIVSACVIFCCTICLTIFIPSKK